MTKEPDWGGEEQTFEPDKKPEIPRHVKYVTQVSESCVIIMVRLVENLLELIIFFVLSSW